MGRYTIENGPA